MTHEEENGQETLADDEDAETQGGEPEAEGGKAGDVEPAVACFNAIPLWALTRLRPGHEWRPGVIRRRHELCHRYLGIDRYRRCRPAAAGAKATPEKLRALQLTKAAELARRRS